MHDFVRDLFPMWRSLTGPGVRQTLAAIAKRIPLTVHEVPTGTPAFDWTVPPEWTLRDAYIVGPDGRRVVDVADSVLHVVGYSVPVRARMPLDALRPHLHSLSDRPDRIPYRTSYYDPAWGFCLRHDDLDRLQDGEYEVVIDSSLGPGSLTYGELSLPGERPDEVVVVAHVCHPGQANDNLSGIAVATFLAQALADRRERRLSYRFLFGPGTIGSLVWLSSHPVERARILGGLVLAGVGDPGAPSYKRSRHGDSPVDRAVELVFSDRPGAQMLPFTPWGYDERQFNSPGLQLPVGLLMRTPHGTYAEYHTSADDPDFVRPESLAESLEIAKRILAVLDADRIYVNQAPMGEPQLGKRGLYDAVGGASGRPDQLALLWVLNQADGSRGLLDIARRSGVPFERLQDAAAALQRAGLLQEMNVDVKDRMGGDGPGPSGPR